MISLSGKSIVYDLIEILFGGLLCSDDNRKFKVVSECSLMLRKKDPCEKRWSLSLSSSCERKDFKTSFMVFY